MKKILIIALALAVFQKWDAIESFIYPPPEFVAEQNVKVILYATEWCGYCAKTRSLLQANNIDYFEYDIEKSQIGNEQYKSLGGNGVPLLLINGEVVRGYNPNRILSLTSSM